MFSCCRAVSIALLIAFLACADPPLAKDHETDQDQHAEHEHEAHERGVVELSAEAAARAGLRTATVAERVLAGELQTTGEVDFDHDRLAHVSPRITGRVHRVAAMLGEQVAAGQTLAEIDAIELGQAKAEHLQAKAQEELARTNYERAKGLFDDAIVAQQRVLEAEAHLRETTAALRTSAETLRLYGLSRQQVAKLDYEDAAASIYPLRAPFAGTIVERHATLGELVTPERNLFTLADLSHVWIWIDVFQRDLARVHLEDQVQARVDAFPDVAFTGTVSYLSARVDAETRTLRARLDVANPGGKLRPGMFVDVALVDPHGVDEGVQAASLVVPESALVRDSEETAVFVASGERRFQRRAVQVGRRAGSWVEILDGLTAGEEVVVEGAFLLKSAAAKESMGGGHAH